MKDNRLKTPVLFLIWNRPETTKLVFERISKARPRKLYIAADGPRENVVTDNQRCEEVRKIVSKIDWKCEAHKLFRPKNLGLKKSVSESINWFFSKNSEGIILEDDCLPEISFFDFCTEMLAQYKNNEKVMHISGDNFQPKNTWNKNSYYFSRYPHVWGWATWRRAWKQYDIEMKSWCDFKKSKAFKTYFPNYWERSYWMVLMDAVKKNKISTWDYQWVFSIWKHNGIAVNPGVNLISNLGFGKDAVHTKTKKSKLSKVGTEEINHNLKKREIQVDRERDSFVSKKVFNINPLSVIAKATYYKLF